MMILNDYLIRNREEKMMKIFMHKLMKNKTYKIDTRSIWWKFRYR